MVGDETVEVEVDANFGQTNIVIVGLPDAAVKESRDRTLTALTTRLYDVTGGQILLDGVDIRNLNRGELRSHIAMAFEDATLFSTTVRENVMLGTPIDESLPAEQATAIAEAKLKQAATAQP